MRSYKWFLPLFFLVCFSACVDDEICEEATANPLRIGFYAPGELEPVQRPIDSLTVFGVGRPDSMIYDNAYSVFLAELPLNPNRDTTAFVLEFPLQTDTLMVVYQRELNLISVECGFAMFFELEGIQNTENFITSTTISISEVINTFDEHIQILVPAPPPPDIE